jgi:hypothetical protein
VIYPPHDDMPTTERQYVTLYNSVIHHLIEAIDADSGPMAGILQCVLYGAFASQFPPGHHARTPTGFLAFQNQLREEVNQAGAMQWLHEIPHVDPTFPGIIAV